MALGPLAVQADDDMLQISELFPEGRHLAELSYISVDTLDGNTDLWIPRYTYAYNNSLRVSAGTGLVELDDQSNTRGMTDTSLLLQYDPSAQLTANAFIPDAVGLTFGLQVPTGDHEKGLGEDLWTAQVGAGWLVDFPLSFWLLPSFQHEFSFSESSDTASRQQTDLGLGLYWLFNFRGWLGFEPVIAYDHKEKDSGLDWSVVAGKSWISGWALECRWFSNDRIGRRGERDDELLQFSVSYQFGAPPRSSQ